MAKRWYYKDENGNKVPVPQYKINADDYYTKAMSDSRYYEKQATDTLLTDKVSKSDIVQSTGTSETAVMSQNASTMAFAANTPSGDPMHNVYVEVGAKWNAKTGFWELNGLKDITNEQMLTIYVETNNFLMYQSDLQACYCFSKCRTNIPNREYLSSISRLRSGWTDFFRQSDNLEVVVFKNFPNYFFKPNTINGAFYYCYKLRLIDGILDVSECQKINSNYFVDCVKLESVKLYKLNYSIGLASCKMLSSESVQYMIENATDKTIIITLHPEAYDRAIADTGVQTALANKPNVSLAKDLEYLTLSALEDGEITITISSDLGSACATSLSYSKDKSVWKKTNVDGRYHTITIPVSHGDKVYLKGKAKQWYDPSGPGGASIDSTANINVSGNIMSLLYEDNFKDKTVFPDNSKYAFSYLFSRNKHLCSIEKLILPATTLAEGCYRFMFNGCSSLTTAPALPATKLVVNCYWGMFNSCTSLNSITMLATDISASNCLDDWVSGVAATGTFTKAASMTSLPSGASGIPTGWTVENV